MRLLSNYSSNHFGLNIDSGKIQKQIYAPVVNRPILDIA